MHATTQGATAMMIGSASRHAIVRSDNAGSATNTPKAFYQPGVEDGAYQLRFAWTSWPACGCSFSQRPVQLIEQTKPLWEQDRLRVLEYRWTDECVQILFSTTPDVAPIFLAQRAKGRLHHALRSAGIRVPFSRKLAVRSVGRNTRRDVEAYLERQAVKERFVDPEFARRMGELTVVNPSVDLSQPTETLRSRYWYNLHLVLVVEQHARIRSWPVLTGLRDTFLQIAARKDHAVSRLSVMPSHLHAALRVEPDRSPLELVFSYQNNLVYLQQLGRLWDKGFYVGTFGEYSMQAVRNSV
jgi:REP element-mobilizing transposase RayT